MSARIREISSRDNPLIKTSIELATSAKSRKQLGLAYIEGIHLCVAAAEQNTPVQETLVAQSAFTDLQVQRLLETLPSYAVVPDPLFRTISQLVQGASIVQWIKTPQLAAPEQISIDAVYLDGIQDPGNLGSILRTCAAAGIGLVLASHDCVDAWSPKVLRAAMGAHFALGIAQGLQWDELFMRIRVPLMATVLDAQQSVYQCDLSGPRVWCFGNEGQGLRAPVLQSANDAGLLVHIPQAAQVESLNVAAAVAVCLFEQQRQRFYSVIDQ